MGLRLIFLLTLAGLISTSLSQEFKLLSPVILDLGAIKEDSVVSGQIRFTNSGDKPLKIGRIQTSCGCTATQLDKLIYQPNEEGSIEVRFNSKGYSGLVRKTVTIFIEEGTPSSARVTLQVVVKPQLEINPAFVDMQDIPFKDSSVKRTLVITNNYDQNLVVDKITTNIKTLTIKPTQFVLKPGSSQTLDLKYQPVSEGRNDGYIEIEFKKPVEKMKRVPVFIKVIQ